MDQMQADTDAGMFAWLLDHPEDMAIMLVDAYAGRR